MLSAVISENPEKQGVFGTSVATYRHYMHRDDQCNRAHSVSFFSRNSGIRSNAQYAKR
jgi:hypothetical protein